MILLLMILSISFLFGGARIILKKTGFWWTSLGIAFLFLGLWAAFVVPTLAEIVIK